jgi:dihydroxy-acid dehydratase
VIEIDINNNRLQVLISEEEMARRQQQPLKRPDHPAPGMLTAYRKMVTGAESGALWL